MLMKFMCFVFVPFYIVHGSKFATIRSFFKSPQVLFPDNNDSSCSSSSAAIEALTQSFLLRAGAPGNTFYWHYTGHMRNPVTGVADVGIEGIEVTKSLDLGYASQPSLWHYLQQLTTPASITSAPPPPAAAVPSPPAAAAVPAAPALENVYRTPPLFTGSFLSRKLFFYTHPSNRSSLLLSHQVRSGLSPRRLVTHPVVSSSQKITMGVIPASKRYSDNGDKKSVEGRGSGDSKDGFFSRVLYPSGRAIWNTHFEIVDMNANNPPIRSPFLRLLTNSKRPFFEWINNVQPPKKVIDVMSLCMS
jgi:hypothetical protein